ncbi:hypothetical protein [Halopseudomonas salegens]|uniref:Uncharacterized protein n=1 Tax=Halopseudomonas salegens TaxID=1434072 RepID=A0A1H2FA76_9GAMM|nr:hypothetical protein [Halopseudomonas salegens]SDU04153.1 hypothetical protein SAMN05216210_1401 [Halopseudomonas salegens]
MCHSFCVRRIFAALWLSCAFIAPTAIAADVTSTPPSGGGFTVTDSTGTIDRFRVDEGGDVTIPGLPGAADADTATCFDSTTGQLGPCAAAAGGGDLDFANFYALMPPDNAATVASGGDVDFPQDGPNSGGGITRLGVDSFNLAAIGTYQVMFQVSVSEPAQLVLTLDGVDLAYTVVGRATGTSQLTGMALVNTSSANSVLTVRNPPGSPTALTVTPLAGGTSPVSAHLVITQLR